MQTKTKTREEMDIAWKELVRELTDENLYKDKIKDICFICGIWYRNSWELYQVYGNCCNVCSGRVVSVLYCQKQRTKSPLTYEEARLLLAARRKWILKEYMYLPPRKRREMNALEKNNILSSCNE